MRERQRSGAARSGQVIDSAEYVAKRILEAAKTEPAEMYME
jgi:hypothetical protein